MNSNGIFAGMNWSLLVNEMDSFVRERIANDK